MKLPYKLLTQHTNYYNIGTILSIIKVYDTNYLSVLVTVI